jgi:hypothetical protein
MLLVPGPVQDDEVHVRVQPQIGRGPLHHGDRAGLSAELTLLRRAATELPPDAPRYIRLHFIVDTRLPVAHDRPASGRARDRSFRGSLSRGRMQPQIPGTAIAGQGDQEATL